MFLLGGAGLGAHTCASRMCVAVPAGASQQHWGRGSGWYHGEEQGPWLGQQGTIKTLASVFFSLYCLAGDPGLLSPSPIKGWQLLPDPKPALAGSCLENRAPPCHQKRLLSLYYSRPSTHHPPKTRLIFGAPRTTFADLGLLPLPLRVDSWQIQ